jgi:hypothetical protein
MAKGIIKDLDKGFYDAAREKGLHPLTYLTDLVRPEPPEVKAVEGRVRQRLLAQRKFAPEILDGALSGRIGEVAYQLAGLEKELEARGIRGEDTIEKAFFTSANGPNQPLFPVFLASKIIAGQLATSLVPFLVAADVRINSHVQEKVTVADTTETRQLKQIGEGVDLPKTVISRTNANITLSKYGRLLEVTYEAVRLLHLDVVGLQMERIGRQIGIDQSDDCIETLLAGDGSNGSAVSYLTAEAAGVLDYDELVRLFLQFPIGYEMRHAVLNDTLLRTILNMAEFKDPTAGFSFQRTGSIPGPMGAIFHRWTSTGSASFGTDRILAVDNTGAAILYREGDLLEEADRLIDKQMHRRTMSEWIGIAKWDNSATAALKLN